MNTEQAMSEFFARGGQIVKLPPCNMQLEGAVPRDSLPDKPDAWTAWSHPKTAPKERDYAAKANAREEVRRIEKAKAIRNSMVAVRKKSPAKRTMAVARKKSANNRKIDFEARCLRICKAYRDEQSLSTIERLAAEESVKVERVRRILLNHGYKDIPARQADRARKETLEEIAARDAGIVKAYDAGDPIENIAAQFRVSTRTVRRVAAAAGTDRRCTQGMYAPPRKVADDLDRAMSAMYRDGWSVAQVALAFGVGQGLVAGAMARTWTSRRPMGTHGSREGMTPPNMRGAA